MPLYLKIVIACCSTAVFVILLFMVYRYCKYGFTWGILEPLCHRKRKYLVKTSNPGGTPACAEFISGEDKLPWPRLPSRSSVVIQEMELEPMLTTSPTVQRTPAITTAGMSGISPHSDAVQVTLDNVARALETTVGLNFDCYYKKKQLRAKRKGMTPTP